MTNTAADLIVISGGPGAGKTTVLGQLALAGYSVVPEVARRIIAERKAMQLSPRPEPAEFAQTIFNRDIEQYEAAKAVSGISFFDRSIIDSLGFLKGLGLVTEHQQNVVVERYPYHCEVFIFPPWKDIYHTDSERDQTYEESVEVYHSICRFYGQCGYSLVEVPRAGVDERCEFLVRHTAEI